MSVAGKEPEPAAGSGGVGGAARVQGDARNTGDPSARPESGRARPYKPKAKSGRGQRESEGIVVPAIAVTNNAAGGKSPFRSCFDTIDHGKLMLLVARRVSDRRMLKLLRQWLEAGVMEGGEVHETRVGTPQGGVISPLLSNIYLHVLDTLWTRHSASLGTLVRYADDFVVMCRTKQDCEEAERRIRVILGRLGLELHPEKARRAELFDGKEGFDFLGCHLHKRLSGPLLEKTGRRLYSLQRWPSQRSMRRIRSRIRELTPRSRCHADLRDVIAALNPVLRGWGNYFRTGNAAKKFVETDR